MRNMGKIIALFGILFSSYLPLSVWAVMSMPYGWYGEANVGFTNILDKNYPGSTTTVRYGLNINAGYKFMPYFGGEIGYTYYSNITIEDPFGTTAATDRHHSYYLAGKAILPLADTGAEAFAKVGAARVKSKLGIDNSLAAANIGLTSSSNSATGLYFAVGLSYNFTPAFALNAQWARAKGNSGTGTPELYGIGITFIGC